MSETYHTTRAISLFNKKLSSHLTVADYDALWATAALLGLLASTAIDTTPEQSFPLTPPSSTDLEWFVLSDGKKAVWALTNPLRPSSVFSSMAHEYAAWDFPIPASGAAGMDDRLALLCGITETSCPANNPYYAYAAWHAQAHFQARANLRLLHLDLDAGARSSSSGHEKDVKSVGDVNVTYVSQSQERCLQLLRKRDKVALVLLAMWYKRCESACWWIERRAKIEGRAIRLFLQQHHPDDTIIFELLADLDAGDGTYIRPDVSGKSCIIRETAWPGFADSDLQTAN